MSPINLAQGGGPIPRKKMDEISALITAAGASTRMGTGKKKELELISGISVLARAVAPFIETGFFSHIVITHSRGDRKAVELLLGNLNVDCILVEGGDTRQQSVYNGLLALKDLAQKYLLIHDGSRPWITRLLIGQVLDGAIRYGACIPVVPPVNALKRISENGTVVDHLEKDNHACAQTPQGFKFLEILQAHIAAKEADRTYSDDAQAYDVAIGPVHTIPGDPSNIKITYRHDLP